MLSDTMTKILLMTVILLPVTVGIVLQFLNHSSRKTKCIFAACALAIEALMVTALLFSEETGFELFRMSDTLIVALRMDRLSKIFMALASYGFLIAGIYSFRYMDEEEKEGSFKEKTFYLFFFITLGALMGMDLAKNLISMYFFFEMLTLFSMPMVLFERAEASIQAALKYLFYSVAGAFLALGLIFVLSQYVTTMDFNLGGNLDANKVANHETLLWIMSFLGIVGFGAKAGMYPLHGWLPTAHPVAPSPASAILSGIITKAGVLAIIRLVFYTIGTSFLQGTWVQIALLSLSLLTVFMGSMMAYLEKNLKKRLAFSSVSQISYVLFGVFLMSEAGLSGALMQVLAHATAKIGLFLCAGSFIYVYQYRRVEDLVGIGKKMPWTLGVFAMVSLSLVGIPPFAGFVSKWFLAEASLSSGIAVIDWLGPVILLVSALLTAGYLFPVVVKGFFPGKNYVDDGKQPSCAKEGGALMIVPLVLLAILSVLLGLLGGGLV